MLKGPLGPVCSTYVGPSTALPLELQGQPPLGEQLEQQLDRGVLQALLSVLHLGEGEQRERVMTEEILFVGLLLPI